jgi:protein ImuA
MLGVSAETLESLRARIATIEKRPALTDHPAPHVRDSGLVLALPGQLQEIFADARRNAGSTLGFALGMAGGLLTGRRPALLIVQMKHESADMGVPYGAGLKSFGIDPDSVVLVRAETITEFLWAIEEAIGCEAVAAVIADLGRPHREFDFTASRRLSLRVASGGSTVFILCYGEERTCAGGSNRSPAPRPCSMPARQRVRAFTPSSRRDGSGENGATPGSR